MENFGNESNFSSLSLKVYIINLLLYVCGEWRMGESLVMMDTRLFMHFKPYQQSGIALCL